MRKRKNRIACIVIKLIVIYYIVTLGYIQKGKYMHALAID